VPYGQAREPLALNDGFQENYTVGSNVSCCRSETMTGDGRAVVARRSMSAHIRPGAAVKN
jgi:hypothetical protein